MRLQDLADTAKQQLAEVTGLKPVTVTKTYKDEQGWHVSLDMLEMPRIPPATDVLGTYDVLVDDSGNLVQFERRRTHLRGDTMEDNEGE